MDDIEKKKAKIINLFKEESVPPTQDRIKIKGNHNVTVAGNTMGDVNINVKKVTRPKFTPTSEHISHTTAKKIKDRIDTLVNFEAVTKQQKSALYAKWYRVLKNRYKVTSYSAIHHHLGDEALS